MVGDSWKNLLDERGVQMNFLGYLIIMAVFLGISWVIRIFISQDVSSRMDRKVAEEKAGFCTFPREMTGE